MQESLSYRDIQYNRRNEQAVVTDLNTQEADFDNFRIYLSERFPGDNRILWAFDTAREAHQDDIRKSGQQYLGHVTSVTLWGIDELGIKDEELLSDLVCAWVLHDRPEDKDEDMKKMRYTDWKEKAKKEYIPNIGERATRFLINLTRPQVNTDMGEEADILSKDQAKQMYFDLLAMNPMAAVAKIPDYVDNIMTLEYFDIKKQNEKIEAMLNVYVPIFIHHLGAEDGKYDHIFNNALSVTMFVIDRLKQKQKKENNPEIEELAS